MSRLADFAIFRARGEVQEGAATSTCELTVDPSGITIAPPDGEPRIWPAHEIVAVERVGYEMAVRRAFGREGLVLRRFARRTDELELALRRCRADALARLMAPPDRNPQEITEAAGATPGFLYRYEDGLRWVPDAGSCFVRLYGELDSARFCADDYTVILDGPLGGSELSGLRRISRELDAETDRRIEQARAQFADALELAGLPWANDARMGRIRQQVPFTPTVAQIAQVEGAAGLVCDQRRDFWAILHEADAIRRLVLSADPQGQLRLVALCPVGAGELYEVLSEADHASFVFARAEDAVRAWTEVGFRREPIFADNEAEQYRVLAGVLPSLYAARAGLRRRVVHDEPDAWWRRLQ